MNRYAQGILSEFMSKENQSHLYGYLKMKFSGDVAVVGFLNNHLYTNMEHFYERMVQEMLLSDPLPGITMYDQLECFNRQFLASEESLIRDHVIGMVEETPIYSVNDGISTTRYGLQHYQGKPDDILKSWYENAGRQAQARDDNQGDIYPNNTYYNNSAIGDTVGHHTGIINSRYNNLPGSRGSCRTPVIESMSNQGNHNQMTGRSPQKSSGQSIERMVTDGPRTEGPIYPFNTHDPYSTARTYAYADAPNRCNNNSQAGMITGITFSDQRKFGTSNHVSMYENTSYKASLNSHDAPWQYSVFGDSTPAADARLMERRVFRSNYGHAYDKLGRSNKVENGIPTFEVRLQRRALDRNIDEGLRNAEKECIQYSHDMDSLNDRIDRKRANNAKYDPRWPDCDSATTYAIKGMKLYGTTVDISDDMRYQ